MTATHYGNRPSSITRLLILALALSFIVSGAALGQTTTTSRTNESRPYSDSITNPCNGETVVFEGRIHFNEKTQVSNDGRIHFIAADNFNGRGVGLVTGLEYSVGGTLNANSKFPSGPIKFRQRTKVISNGPSDNFFATFVFHVSGNGTPTRTTMESDCRGQKGGVL